MGKCKFDVAWVGRCREDAADCSEYCSKHSGYKCVSCKEQATHDCDHTAQLVCGSPLCDNCRGFQDPSASYGFFGFGGHSHHSKQWQAQRSADQSGAA